MIKVVLADDHEMLRQGLCAQFEACEDIAVLAEAGSLVELQWKLNGLDPDILILDIKLPDGNGLSIIPSLKSSHPRCQVVVLTMFENQRYAQYALQSGALGFVVKGEAFENLAQAVRDVVAGKPYYSPNLPPQRSPGNAPSKRSGLVDSLSRREFEVLTLLSSGLALKEAARQMGITVNTVTTYRARLMEKLGLDNKADLVRVALENSIVS